MSKAKRIVTIISDWNDNSFYSGSVKGNLKRLSPDCELIEITHQVMPYNIAQAAFILRNTYPSFPEGTIHIIGIDSEYADDKPYLVVIENGQYFIGTDNGIFYLIFEKNPDKIIRINVPDSLKATTFPELHVFSKLAAELCNNRPIEEFGDDIEEVTMQRNLHPAYEESVINGNVIYVDSYFNLITNISKNLFEKVGQGRPFDIIVQNYAYKINKINSRYNQTPKAELLAVFNSAGLLEIATNKSPAAEVLSLDTKSNIRVKFYDSQDS